MTAAQTPLIADAAWQRSAPANEGVKFLLVDDREENLLVLAELLRGDGVQLLLARSGMEALELLLVHDVALALLDVQMPEMGGFELAEIMRSNERSRNVPIIFLTAGARDQQPLFKGYESGAVDFLFKPIEPRILESKARVFVQLYLQRRQLARELAERTETLKLNEMFAAVLGHDLRGPLSAILLSAHVLRKRDDPAIQAVGDRLLRSGTWMSRMIEDLLDLSRTRLGGGMPLRRVQCDLGVVLERVVQERQAGQPDGRLHLSRTGDLQGDWDEDRLTQVAANLVGNALQHGQDGQPVQIALDGSAAGAVQLSVANHGSIPPEFLPHIFDPFRSKQKQSSRSQGLGLGLYIVQQIVLAHGGRVSVQSSDADGTRFCIRLPRGAGADAASGWSSGADSGAESGARSGAGSGTGAAAA